MGPREVISAQEKSLEMIKETPNDGGDLDNVSSHHGSSLAGSVDTASNGGQSKDQRVSFSKFAVFFVLMVSAIAIGTLTYILLSNDEEEDFQNHVSLVLGWLAGSCLRGDQYFVLLHNIVHKAARVFCSPIKFCIFILY